MNEFLRSPKGRLAIKVYENQENNLTFYIVDPDASHYDSAMASSRVMRAALQKIAINNQLDPDDEDLSRRITANVLYDIWRRLLPFILVDREWKRVLPDNPTREQMQRFTDLLDADKIADSVWDLIQEVQNPLV